MLGRITAEARDRAKALKSRGAELERAAAAAPAAPSLEGALRRADVAVVAEVKRRSPSMGVINSTIDAATQATRYVAGGAAALSILTEPAHFGGSAQDLVDVRAALGVPLLKKDFHVAHLQLVEARALGAAAALLIVRALSPDELDALVPFGHDLGLDLIVEVRDERELDRALAAGARIVGVNNRDLESLAIDPETGLRIVPLIPDGCVAVYESGVHGRADVERAAEVGADAVLVGSSVSGAADPAAAVRALTAVPRRGR